MATRCKLEIKLEHGAKVVVDQVESVLFVRICPYLNHEFSTTNPKRVYCSRSHQVMFQAKKKG